MTLAATLYAVVLLPDSVLRLALWILTHTLYLTRVEGRDNIPERGGALFLARKMTLLEAVLLAASTDRPIRFLLGEPDGNRAPTRLERLLRVAPFSTFRERESRRPGDCAERRAGCVRGGRSRVRCR